MLNSIKVVRTTETTGRGMLIYEIPGIRSRLTTPLDSSRQETRQDAPTFGPARGTLANQVTDTQFTTMEGLTLAVLATTQAAVHPMSNRDSLRRLPDGWRLHRK
jgi:hypothetical protein